MHKPRTHHRHQFSKWHLFWSSVVLFGLANLIWFIFRTGTKPARIIYPCQQTALNNIKLSIGSLLTTFSIASIWFKIRQWFSIPRIAIALVIISTIISGSLFQMAITAPTEVTLDLSSATATKTPTSDIFVVNGREAAHFDQLLSLMNTHGIYFYQSSNTGANQGPEGLFTSADVIIIKINCQWSHRGGTNTDLLKEIIEAIIAHPDGFTGEIIVADNGQGRGSMKWDRANANNQAQSTQDVVDEFASSWKISTYLWDTIQNVEVEEYSMGDMNDGYVVNDTADPDTGINVSYPKFSTPYDTYISFKHGVWNGTAYEQKVKIINVPVLKSHSGFGVTACVKHYMGVQSQGVANGHSCVGTGGMATIMVECGLPTLNVIDAKWVNANPSPSAFVGPYTLNSYATRTNVLLAGFDPVALDYWAAKHILIQTAHLIGYDDPYALDPDSVTKGNLDEVFGVWLNKSRDEFLQNNFNVTSNEQQMNVYLYTHLSPIEPGLNIYMWIGIIGVGVITVVTIVIVWITKRKRIKKQHQLK